MIILAVIEPPVSLPFPSLIHTLPVVVYTIIVLYLAFLEGAEFVRVLDNSLFAREGTEWFVFQNLCLQFYWL